MKKKPDIALPNLKNRFPDSVTHTDMKKAGWIFILLILGVTVYGQYQDARLWASLSIRYDPGKKWKIGLEEEARFFENISRLDKLNTELDLNYQISKLVDGGILYRLIGNPETRGNFDFNHRFGAYLDIQKKYARWTCSFKTAFQKTYPGFQRTSERYLPENYVRAQAEVSREFKNKKTEPYTNIEFWYVMQTGEQAFIDQYRFTIGIKQKINKSNRLNFFYRIQQEMQVKNPLTAHIIGVGYGFVVRR
jgi:hypothetical protein